jgi:hypothetical protein
MTVVWLWDVPGLASNALGVCDKETRARRAAPVRLRGGHASAVVVQAARVLRADRQPVAGAAWKADPVAPWLSS